MTDKQYYYKNAWNDYVEVPDIVAEAKEFLADKLPVKDNPLFTSSELVRDFLTLACVDEKQEHFSVVFLSNDLSFIAHKVLFHGTINGSAVYIRPIIQNALELGASAIILCHNHPSGNVEPSNSDKTITSKIEKACQLFDIRVLDHIIVGIGETFSFAEKGLM